MTGSPLTIIAYTHAYRTFQCAKRQRATAWMEKRLLGLSSLLCDFG